MKIGFCQYDVKHKNIEENIITIETMLKDVSADLIVLPELALTGYYFNQKDTLIELSEKINDRTIDSLTHLSKKTHSTYVIGLGEVEDKKLYNTAYVINDKGIIGKHRKINLTDNETIFDAGDTVEIINLGTYKLGIAICFETWFPEMFRILCDQGADLVVCPSNFGGPYTGDVVKVRALENSIPIVLTNRLGREIIDGSEVYFRGESAIIDGHGHSVSTAGSEPIISLYDIDLSLYNRNRNLICSNVNEQRKRYKK